MGGRNAPGMHAFLCYSPEDGPAVDRLQAALEAAGIGVWRDTEGLSPGDVAGRRSGRRSLAVRSSSWPAFPGLGWTGNGRISRSNWGWLSRRCNGADRTFRGWCRSGWMSA